MIPVTLSKLNISSLVTPVMVYAKVSPSTSEAITVPTDVPIDASLVIEKV
jgi:hypothetical protein